MDRNRTLRILGMIVAAMIHFAPSANAADWVRRIAVGNCQNGTNSCVGLSSVTPAGKLVTITHINCQVNTVANPDGLAPVFLQRKNAAGTTILIEAGFPPIQTGTSGATWKYALAHQTRFLIPANTRPAVRAVAEAVNQIKALDCYLAGDLN